MFETRRKENKAKIRLTKKDLEGRNIESTKSSMGKEDWEIARHSTYCSKDIDLKKLSMQKKDSKKENLGKVLRQESSRWKERQLSAIMSTKESVKQ